ncbi:MAG: DUF2079 domain-containing protein, partial [Candidatus Micrarchaeota archaeon]|nr:DUF2079 domain-containing protein [Candidatus Micrarchaeota archaeon]
YWTYFDNLLYSTYQATFYDIGLETYSTYWHLHGATSFSLFNAVQYLVFANHISPFRLLLLPFFALYQYPITLIALQNIAIAATALLVYLASDLVLKEKNVSMALALAFLLNPGVSGMLYFPIHSESFIPLFYILSFYFYTKVDRHLFLLSYGLLLCTMEEAPIVGASLLLGLFIFRAGSSIGKDTAKNSQVALLKLASVMTLVAILAYFAIGNYLVSNYKSVSYADLPPIVRYGNFFSTGISLLTSPSSAYSPSLVYAEGLIGLGIIFLGFGFGSLRVPLVSIILFLPWLVSVFILHNPLIADYFAQYYAFVVGGSFVAALYGYKLMSKHSSTIRLWAANIDLGSFSRSTILPIAFAIAIPSALTLSVITIANTTSYNYSQINNALSGIPQNSTIMSQGNVLPHLYGIRLVEFPKNSTISDSPFVANGIALNWFSPQYIVVYTNTSAGKTDLGFDPKTLLSYVNSSYYVYYNESGLTIFKKH